MSAGTMRALPLLDPYPERTDARVHWLDGVESALRLGPQIVAAGFRARRVRRLVAAVNAREPHLMGLGDAALEDLARSERARLRRGGLSDPSIASCFGLIRELARRRLGLRHHDVQIEGGLALLDGCVAEMATGEGKTVTAALAVATAAFVGIPVHVVTVNDYLADRDAEQIGPLYAALGLTVGVVVHGRTTDERRAAYGCDIVYASNKEIAFDYLRDRLILGAQPRQAPLKLQRLLRPEEADAGLVMRGLPFAIVDEADSVLIDEARTPLIISRQTDAAEERRRAEEALALADALDEGRDYRVLREERRLELTPAGCVRLAQRGQALGGMWRSKVRREEAARQALSARFLFHRGDHYLVRDGRVEIVDEYTGRVMADRSWSDGLHQLVEVKEGCEVTPRKTPMARMTYQRFFRRYLRLAGMSGTARSAAAEFWSVYRLRVVQIDTNVPTLRRRLPAIVCADQDAKLEAILAETRIVLGQGRPVLVGSRSVSASARISAAFALAGLEHAVLNAENDKDEAAIIAAAGTAGCLTVATNMAGRGVDIGIEDVVADRGGLHVILTERHDAKRIDDQLAGRTARRGQPGSTQDILALDDHLLELAPRNPLRLLARYGGPLRHPATTLLFRAAQRRAERAHFRARKDLLAEDRRLGDLLAFTGGME